jgi:hypothetical protein
VIGLPSIATTSTMPSVRIATSTGPVGRFVSRIVYQSPVPGTVQAALAMWHFWTSVPRPLSIEIMSADSSSMTSIDVVPVPERMFGKT